MYKRYILYFFLTAASHYIFLGKLEAWLKKYLGAAPNIFLASLELSKKNIRANKLKTGYRVQSCFELALNQKDIFILYQLQEFFGGIGTLRLDKKLNAVRYSVNNLKDLTTVIIPHFENYPLVTQKQADFLLFKQIVELMNKGAHLTFEGLQQIINIKASLNLGIS